MADEERPFLISVRRTWTLWILPVLALLYFLAILVLNAMDYRLEGVTMDQLVLAGVVLFVFIMVVQLFFFLRRRAPKPAAPPPAAPVAAAAPAASSRNGWDDEIVTTSETQQGLRVVEYSAPAKSRHRNAVFTKTYVPVSGAHVLRIETLAAEAGDL